ncbi:MFS transporter [Amycolatopsis sp. NPDC098790]|uniref:MFS transporter n=1 Tax=Amycolatopsis sp. NPDC098790 TaxID=3363939 RepID=UPI003817C701
MGKSETAGRRRDWLALAVLVLPVLLVSVDVTVLGFALPAISEDLRPSAVQQLWFVDVYSLVLGGLLVLMGTLGDRFGRRTVLLWGAAAFGGASVLASIAPSAGFLVAARALLGIGGATLMPSTLALIRGIFTEPARRRVAIAVWAAAFSGGMGLGPVLGGWLLEHFRWGSVFLINVPVMLVLLLVGPFVLPELRDPAPGRFDVLSALLSLAAAVPVIYGIKQFAEHGADRVAVLSVVAGTLVGVWFVRRQRALPNPMLDLALFRDGTFAASVLTETLGVFALVGSLFLVPQYLQLVLGLPALVAALWLLPATAASIVGSLGAVRLARRMPVRRLIAGGLFLAALGFAALAGVGVHAGLVLLIVAMTFVEFGESLSATLTSDLIVSAAAPERAGAAAAISETAYELGAALGTAVLGSVAAAVYRAGIPAEAGEIARETLGGATTTAAGMPSPHREILLETAKQAFVNGFRVSAIAGAVLLAATALLAFVLLRFRGGSPPAASSAARWSARRTSS